jgi:hypothetical protein
MGCEEIQKVSSTDPPAEYRSTPLIRSVNVKDVFGDIQTDYDSFRQGLLPQVVLSTSTLAALFITGNRVTTKVQMRDASVTKSGFRGLIIRIL